MNDEGWTEYEYAVKIGDLIVRAETCHAAEEFAKFHCDIHDEAIVIGRCVTYSAWLPANVTA